MDIIILRTSPLYNIFDFFYILKCELAMRLLRVYIQVLFIHKRLSQTQNLNGYNNFENFTIIQFFHIFLHFKMRISNQTFKGLRAIQIGFLEWIVVVIYQQSCVVRLVPVLDSNNIQLGVPKFDLINVDY